MSVPGMVAAGHQLTANAAQEVLRAGGNAFDAVIAGFFTSCVSEPVLASLGGGGFLLGMPTGSQPFVLDCFTQTPGQAPTGSGADIEQVTVDFGSTTQDFHIGFGTVAVPGIVRGMFEVQKVHGSLPMTELVAQAVALARQGVIISEEQAHIFTLVEPIFISRASGRAVFESTRVPGRVCQAGEVLQMPALAELFEALAIEGEGLFYRGEVARDIADLCQGVSGLGYDDLEHYQCVYRVPLKHQFMGAEVLTNPPPSAGGSLIVFSLALLDKVSDGQFGTAEHVVRFAEIMELTDVARLRATPDANQPWPDLEILLDPNNVKAFRADLRERLQVSRGTTHLSVIDAAGNAAALSVSNGEGCGEIVPGCGLMLNNMLGEADLNPHGIGHYPPGERMSSMMAPTMARLADGTLLATGSGGSRRIRTAILQLLTNVIGYGMDLESAIRAPRVHVEDGVLCIEDGFADAVVAAVAQRYPDFKRWPDRAFFFGGTHSVIARDDELHGCGDPRRGGACV